MLNSVSVEQKILHDKNSRRLLLALISVVTLVLVVVDARSADMPIPDAGISPDTTEEHPLLGTQLRASMNHQLG
jgi:hypothetical protein